MRYLLLLCLPLLSLYAGGTQSWTNSTYPSAQPTFAASSESQVSHKKQGFFARLKAKALRFWQAVKLLTSDQDLIRILIIVLIAALALSVLMWVLPWPVDVLVATVVAIIAIIFLLRYI
ncbi:MAG: hypothetical protein NZ580_05675 [Bacteroidia bacterium]|nr:hypothetical protein [Bacteroidia bacterium]MDW8236052.1 hypothetical protein [Bacteroidia bacterium]